MEIEIVDLRPQDFAPSGSCMCREYKNWVNETSPSGFFHSIQNVLDFGAVQKQALPKFILFFHGQSSAHDSLLDLIMSHKWRLLISLGKLDALHGCEALEIALVYCPVPNQPKRSQFLLDRVGPNRLPAPRFLQSFLDVTLNVVPLDCLGNSVGSDVSQKVFDVSCLPLERGGLFSTCRELFLIDLEQIIQTVDDGRRRFSIPFTVRQYKCAGIRIGGDFKTPAGEESQCLFDSTADRFGLLPVASCERAIIWLSTVTESDAVATRMSILKETSQRMSSRLVVARQA
jgi:hypothetical protein